MQIAVGGCLAQKDRELLLARAPHVDAVFGTHNVSRVGALLELARAGGKPVLEVLDAPGAEEVTDFASAMAVRHDQPYAAWVTIQVGCDNSCAFCIVPEVRGPEASRPFGELRAELVELAARGTVEITLLGQNVNSYGRDLTTKTAGASPGRARLGVDRRQALGERRRLEAPALVRRPAPRARRCSRYPTYPFHEPASEGPSPRDHRRHGRDQSGLRAAPSAFAVG